MWTEVPQCRPSRQDVVPHAIGCCGGSGPPTRCPFLNYWGGGRRSGAMRRAVERQRGMLPSFADSYPLAPTLLGTARRRHALSGGSRSLRQERKPIRLRGLSFFAALARQAMARRVPAVQMSPPMGGICPPAKGTRRSSGRLGETARCERQVTASRSLRGAVL